MTALRRQNELLSLPLLPTKLYRPRLGDQVIARPRLLALLDRNPNRSLTLVSAPAGFGKTTLVAQWLERSPPDQSPSPGRKTAWLSIDEADNDPRRFLLHLTGAIRRVYPDACKETGELLYAQELAPVEYLADVLAHEIAQLPPERLYLVLDDCHTIQNPAVLSLLTALIRQAARQIHLVLLSRMDLSLPLARLRVANALEEIRSRDLRFTREEISGYIRREAGIQLSEAQLDQLEQHTEGWIALLKLAVLLYRSGTDPESFLRGIEGERGYLTNYLVEEVISNQTPQVQEFLLKTSILNRFSAALCDFVMESAVPDRPPPPPEGANPSRSAAIMRYLEDAGMFLVSLDEEKTWYRYHHLFQSLLQQQLVAATGADSVTHLQQRAFAWFETQAMWGDAFDYSLAAGDIESAADLVEEHAQEILNQEGVQTLQNWMQRLPEQEIQRRPALLLTRACLLQTQARTDAIPAVLDLAEQLLDSPVRGESVPGSPKIGDPRQAAEIRAGIYALRASAQHILNEEFVDTVSLAELALSGLPKHWHWFRISATVAGSVARHMLGQGAEAVRDTHAALLREDGPVEISRLGLWLTLCFLHLTNGHMVQLAESAAILLRNASELGHSLSIGWARYFCGLSLYEQNDLAGALEHFQAGSALRYRAPHPTVRDSLLGQALTRAAQGQVTAAGQSIDTVHDFAEETSSVLVLDRARSLHIRLYLMWGDVTSAARLAQESVIHFDSHSLNEIEPPVHTLAWLRFAQGTPEALEEADSLLRQLRQRAADIHGTRWRISALALHSLVLRARGEERHALDTLEEALTLGQPRGWVRSFIDLGPRMAELLSALSDHSAHPAYIAALLRAFDASPLQSAAAVDAPVPTRQLAAPVMPPAESLTMREEQVLAFLARGLSYQEIAEELFITPNTVKKHASNIYSKLGVKRRSQAVAEARRLELLPPN